MENTTKGLFIGPCATESKSDISHLPIEKQESIKRAQMLGVQFGGPFTKVTK